MNKDGYPFNPNKPSKMLGVAAAIGIVAGGYEINKSTHTEAAHHNTTPTPIEVVQPDSLAESVPIRLETGNTLTLPPNPTVNGIHYPKNPPGNGLPR